MPSTRSFRSFTSSRHQSHGHGPNGPPSPTLTATTHASMDFPYRPAVLVTRADLRSSVSAYEQLLSACKAYTSAMLVLSRASAEFAAALEACSKVKGAHEQADKLQACGGLHFLMSNYSQVLADSFWKDFQIPLLETFDGYRNACNERQLLHEKQILERSRILKETEARNMRLGSKGGRGKGAEGGRDLNSFRRALADLQRQVDELDALKGEYYHEVLESEQEMWEFVQSKVTHMTRSQLEIHDRISSKGLSDPILEPLLATIPDPFDSYGPPKSEDQIFSILPPTSLLGASGGSAAGSAIGSGAATPARAFGSGDDSGAEHPGEGRADLSAGSAAGLHSAGAAAGQSSRGAEEDIAPEGFADVKRSNSLFGTLRYEHGPRKGEVADEGEDDGFLQARRATGAAAGESTSGGSTAQLAVDASHDASRARSNHPLSTIQEDGPNAASPTDPPSAEQPEPAAEDAAAPPAGSSLRTSEPAKHRKEASGLPSPSADTSASHISFGERGDTDPEQDHDDA